MYSCYIQLDASMRRVWGESVRIPQTSGIQPASTMHSKTHRPSKYNESCQIEKETTKTLCMRILYTLHITHAVSATKCGVTKMADHLPA